MADLSLIDSEIAWYTLMRALSTDARGRMTLVGLTVEESIQYVEYVRRRAARAKGWREYQKANRPKYLELEQKHQQARCQVLNAENERGLTKPSQH